ncbi:MAG TPA: hypothetical protein VHV77_10315, partial [Pirellulales bacterium]|nr:hypothetical protein [Pirellulales bacterium]
PLKMMASATDQSKLDENRRRKKMRLRSVIGLDFGRGRISEGAVNGKSRRAESRLRLCGGNGPHGRDGPDGGDAEL